MKEEEGGQKVALEFTSCIVFSLTLQVWEGVELLLGSPLVTSPCKICCVVGISRVKRDAGMEFLIRAWSK